MSYDRFGGSIDDVRLYSRGLTPCEVERLYAIESEPALDLLITAPPSGYLTPVNTAVSFEGSFVPGSAGLTYDGEWMLSSADSPTVSVEAVFDGASITNEVIFTIPGIYDLSLTITDSLGRSDSATTVGDLPSFVVVYDPSGGFVTGGGWIWSPEGAFHPDLAEFNDVTGKASFAFVSKYQKKGAGVSTGNTEFHFKAGDLKFKSTSYEWLVVTGSKAKFKGWGTVNGVGSYRFFISAIDGDKNDGDDRFRIKILDVDGPTEVAIYDNHAGASETSPLPASTIIGGGQIVIHGK